MDTGQLLRAIRSDPILNRQCLGVFASDRVPREIKPLPCCAIVNTDPQSKPGQHWILLYFPTGDTCELFDSYGREPDGAVRKLIRPYQVVLANRRQVQSTLSSVCGAHCLYVAHHRARGIPMNEILNHYSSDPVTNDHEVVEFVEQMFDQSVPLLSGDFLTQQICRALVRNL